jgi:hypothetical protein
MQRTARTASEGGAAMQLGNSQKLNIFSMVAARISQQAFIPISVLSSA